MKNRIRAAWAALLGRPVMSGMTLTVQPGPGIRIHDAGGCVVVDNTIRSAK